MTVSQRNRFFAEDNIEIMQPNKPYFKQKIGEMENEDGEKIDVAPHAQMIVKMKAEQPVVPGAMLRKKR